MNIRNRLAHLEDRLAAKHACPACSDVTVALVDAGQEPPRCGACGRVPDLLEIIEEVVESAGSPP